MKGDGAAALLRRARTRRANRADVAENIFKEAALTAQRRGLVAIGVELADQFDPGAVDRRDIALRIKAHAQHRGLAKASWRVSRAT